MLVGEVRAVVLPIAIIQNGGWLNASKRRLSSRQRSSWPTNGIFIPEKPGKLHPAVVMTVA